MGNFEKSGTASFAEVIVDLSIGKGLDYAIPSDLIPNLRRGMHVAVPVRGHMRNGVVVALKNATAFPRVLPIAKIVQDTLIDDDLFELCLWMAKYYNIHLGDVLKSILPATIRKNSEHKQQCCVFRAKSKEELQTICSEIRNQYPAQAQVLDVMLLCKKEMLLTELMEKASVSRSPIETLVKKGYLQLDIVRIDRSPLLDEEYLRVSAKKLNIQQADAFHQIIHAIDEKKFQTHLLYGITGSGKTEIYLQAIEHALKKNLGTIMLVPEISLTTQTIERFRARFENNIAILHSGLSKGERFDEWHRIRRGEAHIVIGARSAIFSPVKQLGLIIVDEEHDHSYKQNEESPCYHARDVAVMRGKLSHSVVILGSATPALESFYNAKNGKYQLNILTERPELAKLPSVTIVDMKKECEKANGYTTFSDLLLTGIKKRQTNGEQVILFLNRRGYHTSQFCQTCGHVIKCPHCDLGLIFHFGEKALKCHLCDFIIKPPPKQCASCGNSDSLKFKGIGTEQIERALHALFPEIRTLRMDADTTRHKGSHEKMFRAFSTGKSDVLIGTQMVTKGLHFPAVTLVAILNSDPGLNLPDFRASEQIFQLITQVAGRAGRGHVPGEVIIQTYMPDNSTIKLAAQQNFEEFFNTEITTRKLFGYPPFCHFVKYCFSGNDENGTNSFAQYFSQKLSLLLGKNAHVHPVTPSGYPKIKDRYRFQFLVRGQNIYFINQVTQSLMQQLPTPSNIRLLIDIDPTSTFF